MIIPITIVFIPLIVVSLIRKLNIPLPEKILDYPLDFVCIVVGLAVSNIFCFVLGVKYLVYNFITFTIASVAVQVHIIFCISEIEMEVNNQNSVSNLSQSEQERNETIPQEEKTGPVVDLNEESSSSAADSSFEEEQIKEE